jgi:DNA-binding transcriptional ArsR family regulator
MNYKQAEKNYKMLANQRRLRIIKYLAKEQRASVKEIASEINLSFKATSKHLLLLKNVGLVDSEQVSSEQYYYLPDKNNFFIKQVLAIL